MNIQIGHYWDDSWRRWLEPELEPEPERDSKPIQTSTEQVADPILTEAEVVALCRAHFATFGGLSAAAAHYGLTDGRLAQIQCGIYVGCPRILLALGIKRERGGVYRWIGGEGPSAPAGSVVDSSKANGSKAQCLEVGLATRRDLLIDALD